MCVCFEILFQLVLLIQPPAFDLHAGSHAPSKPYIVPVRILPTRSPNPQLMSLNSLTPQKTPHPPPPPPGAHQEPAESDIGTDRFGVHWYPTYSYHPEADRPDVFVAWRYHISAVLGMPRPELTSGTTSRRTKVYVWLQDVPSFKTYTPRFMRRLDGVFTLSRFHTLHLPDYAHRVAFVTPNGIDPT